MLSKDKLKDELMKTMGDPSKFPATIEDAKQSMADAYEVYAKDAEDGTGDAPIVYFKDAFVASLNFALTNTAELAASSIEAAITAFWTGASFRLTKYNIVVYSSKVSSVIVTPPIPPSGLGIIFSDLTLESLESRTDRIATAFHNMTVTANGMLVLIPIIPPPPPATTEIVLFTIK